MAEGYLAMARIDRAEAESAIAAQSEVALRD